MAVRSAEDLFLSELRDIYSAEKQAVKAYPRLTKAVASAQLKDALKTHLEQTKQQIERLDRVFEILEKRGGGKTCEGMKGLLTEAAEHAEEIEQGPILDAALIGALQRVEHYEIAAYGTVVALAAAMEHSDIQQLLEETLEEEKETDSKLTEVSEEVNREALGSGEEDDDDEEEEEPEQKRKPSSKKAAKKTAAKSKSRR